MAEIKIEKKAPVWPWIIGALLVIGVLVYYFVLRDDSGDQQTVQKEQTSTDATPKDNGGAVAAYVQYVDAGRNMGLDHEYTSGALSKLTEAVRAKAGQLGYDVSADLPQVEQHAQQIEKDPFETSHADKIHSAADVLAGTMVNMQQQYYPDLNKEAEEVKQAASKIDPNTLTLEQRDAVKNFFDRSATLLQGMK